MVTHFFFILITNNSFLFILDLLALHCNIATTPFSIFSFKLSSPIFILHCLLYLFVPIVAWTSCISLAVVLLQEGTALSSHTNIFQFLYNFFGSIRVKTLNISFLIQFLLAFPLTFLINHIFVLLILVPYFPIDVYDSHAYVDTGIFLDTFFDP